MDPLIGQIQLFPYNFTPEGWKLCDGSMLPVNSNQALYSLVGIRFGGNGTTDFAVPNLLGAEPIPNTHYYIATQGIYPQRQ